MLCPLQPLHSTEYGHVLICHTHCINCRFMVRPVAYCCIFTHRVKKCIQSTRTYLYILSTYIVHIFTNFLPIKSLVTTPQEDGLTYPSSYVHGSYKIPLSSHIGSTPVPILPSKWQLKGVSPC